ncbi:hypothetical protein ANN_13197 [Periplaneta americana]|uniref:Reverse transcriptase domain-containing protein n=1 Tax=Periplaneta americana TaxID=6978 RepID=A0ABQ8TIR3_PERAM|nr:hypothetical protein ANN_13197 [Periplaneta americana]
MLSGKVLRTANTLFSDDQRRHTNADDRHRKFREGRVARTLSIRTGSRLLPFGQVSVCRLKYMHTSLAEYFRNVKPGSKSSKHHKKSTGSTGHKRERRPSGSSVSSLSTVSGSSSHRHRDRHSREHGMSKRRKLHQQPPDEPADSATLRLSSQTCEIERSISICDEESLKCLSTLFYSRLSIDIKLRNFRKTVCTNSSDLPISYYLILDSDERIIVKYVYADDVNMLGENPQTIRENTGILLEACKEIGLEVKPEKTEYMIMSSDQNIVRNGNIKIGNLSFEELEKFKYLEATETYK